MDIFVWIYVLFTSVCAIVVFARSWDKGVDPVLMVTSGSCIGYGIVFAMNL